MPEQRSRNDPADPSVAASSASHRRFRLPAVGLWTSALDVVPMAQARDLAIELESLGYGALWIPEVAGRDPFVHQALLLAATEQIAVATGIANIWARDAVTTACAANALTEAFPERAVIGLGVSHPNLVDDLRGHHYGKPLTAMRAYLDQIDRAPYTASRPTTPVRYVLPHCDRACSVSPRSGRKARTRSS